jgi:hypothetical protein
LQLFAFRRAPSLRDVCSISKFFIFWILPSLSPLLVAASIAISGCRLAGNIVPLYYGWQWKNQGTRTIEDWLGDVYYLQDWRF